MYKCQTKQRKHHKFTSTKQLNENPIIFRSTGLLLNLWSYPDTFEVHKTELYKRFAYNKETAVKRAWKCLIDTGYMIEYKYQGRQTVGICL